MAEGSNNQNLEKKIKKFLDEGLENIDAGTRSRLTRIRTEALSRKKRSLSGLRNWFPLPVVGAAAVTAALVAFLLFKGPFENQSFDNFEDMEILASGDNLELYEDLEFYSWLAEEEYDAG